MKRTSGHEAGPVIRDDEPIILNLPSEREMAKHDQIYASQPWMDAFWKDHATSALAKGILISVIAISSGYRAFTFPADDERVCANGTRRDGSIRYMSRRWMTRKLDELCKAGYLEKRSGDSYGLTKATADAITHVMASPSQANQ